jgi:ubiquinone/menaquinone biosynthesis C-methylase UbiE
MIQNLSIMNQKLTEEEIKAIAAQLRKPDGELGTQVAQIMNVGNQPMNLHTLAVLNPQPLDNILEIGMGNGFFVKNILRLDDSIKYTGCDYSELMVKESIQNNREFVENGRAKFYWSNINNLPFENSIFNKIFTINTFYFWENVSIVLGSHKKVGEKS